jgi:hypothetical protein
MSGLHNITCRIVTGYYCGGRCARCIGESDRNLLTQACAGSLLVAWHLREVEVIGMVGAQNEYDYISVVSFSKSKTK